MRRGAPTRYLAARVSLSQSASRGRAIFSDTFFAVNCRIGLSCARKLRRAARPLKAVASLLAISGDTAITLASSGVSAAPGQADGFEPSTPISLMMISACL